MYEYIQHSYVCAKIQIMYSYCFFQNRHVLKYCDKKDNNRI